jgi:glutathione synthase
VVNDPFWVRNFPEKLLVLDFPTSPADHHRARSRRSAPSRPHMATSSSSRSTAMAARGVPADPNDRNLASLHELFTGINREPLIVQKFLPDVAKGDKRSSWSTASPSARSTACPRKGETRSNMHVGGRPRRIGADRPRPRDLRRHRPRAARAGQVFVGIDVIGDYLTEINVTSPTGIQELERFDGSTSPALIWDAIDARLGPAA